MNAHFLLIRSTLLLTTLLLLWLTSFGQTQVLKDYDFEKGGYSILGTFAESGKNSLRDSMGEFYTDDITLLNRFKKDWTFSVPGKKYACGYHYRILVCRQGQILESFSINLECQEIVTDEGYFYFNTNLLRQFYGKLKKPFRQSHTFNSITEAREFRTAILNDTSLIMTPKPLWTEYEGSFQFTYKCAEGSRDCMNKEKIFKLIEAELKSKYPGENFMLDNAGGSLTEIYVEITCNETLSEKFDLYHRNLESYSGKWESFDLTLETYWKTKP